MKSLHILGLGLLMILVACAPLGEKQIGPFAECRWEYLNGIEPLKNSATHPYFDARFNPFITVSRQGLTARVVGVLSDETMLRFGGDINNIVAAFPYITPVRFVAYHSVRADDLSKSPQWRAANTAGEVISTQVTVWPENTVMLVYPVSVAAPGFNTAAGSWQVLVKDISRPNDRIGAFGRFPFLKYTWKGHALHGPITGDREGDVWALRRGRVSHGCNRMEGEHVVELSVLLGCPANGRGDCAPANEHVVVMEDFDYLPDPGRRDHRTGLIDDYSEISEKWIAVDVADFPRDTSAPLTTEDFYADDFVVLRTTLNKVWRSDVNIPALDGLPESGFGAVRLHQFESWNNLETDFPGSYFQHVRGTDCAD